MIKITMIRLMTIRLAGQTNSTTLWVLIRPA